MLIESLVTLFRHLLFIALGLSGIGFLIGFHELGHFLFCKLFGISTPSFSIGFGPKIFSKKIGETEFSLSLLPLGGYVEIAGAAEIGQGEQKDAQSVDQHSFAVKPFYQKLLVLLGGIAFNLFFAYAALISLAIHKPESTLLYPYNLQPVVDTVAKDSPAEKYGLQPNDEIVSINNTIIDSNMGQLLDIPRQRPNLSTDMVVKRNQQIVHLSVTPDSITHPQSNQVMGFLGISYKALASSSFIESIKRGFSLANYYVIHTAKDLVNMITQRNIKGLGGPLMIVSISSKQAAQGVSNFFLLLAIISINLALLNLIPLPIFDGGQILFYTIEAIIGRPLSRRVREYIHLATWLLVLSLLIFISIRDVSRIASPLIESIKPHLQSLGLYK